MSLKNPLTLAAIKPAFDMQHSTLTTVLLRSPIYCDIYLQVPCNLKDLMTRKLYVVGPYKIIT